MMTPSEKLDAKNTLDQIESLLAVQQLQIKTQWNNTTKLKFWKRKKLQKQFDESKVQMIKIKAARVMLRKKGKLPAMEES